MQKRQHCTFFSWDDELLVSQYSKDEGVHGCQQQSEVKDQKIAKLKRKLSYERNRGKLKDCVIVFSWVLIVILCTVLAIRCSGCRQ